MASSVSPEDYDSRTSSIGRKRTVDEFKEPEHLSVLSDSSDDELPAHINKRRKQDLSNTNPAIFSDDIGQLDQSNSRHTTDSLSSQPNSPKLKQSDPDTPQTSWNQGLQGGIRTTFASRKAPLQMQGSQDASYLQQNLELSNTTPITKDINQQDPAASNQSKLIIGEAKKISTFQSDDCLNPEPSTFLSRGITWKIPEMLGGKGGRTDIQDLDLNLKSSFGLHFARNNSENVDLLDTKLVKDAFAEYIKRYYGHLSEATTQPIITGAKLKKSQFFFQKIKKDLATRDKTLIKLADSKPVDKKHINASQLRQFSDRNLLADVVPPETSDLKLQGSGTSSVASQEPLNSLGLQVQAELSSGIGHDRLSLSISPLLYPGDVNMDLSTARPGGHRNINVSTSENGHEVAGYSPSSPSGVNLVTAPKSKRLTTETKDSEMSRSDLAAITKYFPEPRDAFSSISCLTCGGTGHNSFRCPALICSTCGAQGLHFTIACPQTQRCGKCRQLGHQKAACPEKLAAALCNGIRCEICRSIHHVEESCPLLWRSFKPSDLLIVKVDSLPVSCYCCGADGHYGPECGLHRGSLRTGGHTWSQANKDQYEDPMAKSRAVSAGKDYKTNGKPKKNFFIRGKAGYDALNDDSDDTITGFIRPKIDTASRQKGHIRVQAKNLSDNQKVQDSTSSLEHRTYRPQPRSPPSSYSLRRNEHLHFDGKPYRSDSARYLRERSFSPPPTFRDEDYNRNLLENYNGNNNMSHQSQPHFKHRGAQSRSGRSRSRGRGGKRGK